MSDYPGDPTPHDSSSELAGFCAEVTRLRSLSDEAFEALLPIALPELHATIRAVSRQVPGS